MDGLDSARSLRQHEHPIRHRNALADVVRDQDGCFALFADDALDVALEEEVAPQI